MKRTSWLLLVTVALIAFSACSSEIPQEKVQEKTAEMISDDALLEIAITDGAEAVVEKYKSLKEKNPEIYGVYEFDNILNRVGLRLLRDGHKQEALAVLKLNVEEFPKQHNPWDSLGMITAEMGNLEEAKKYFNKSLSIEPGFRDSISGLYRIYARQLIHDIEEVGVDLALKNYQEMLDAGSEEFDLTQYRANNHLNLAGYNLIRAGKYEEAVMVLKLFADTYPDKANPQDSLAEAYLNQKDFENAKKHYRKSLELNNNPGSALYRSGMTGLRKIYALENYTKEEFRIPMRDGKTLFTQVYAPKDKSKNYPILLLRTPYRVFPYGEGFRDQLGPNEFFVEEGYIFVYQDVRGRFMSEGEFAHMRPIVDDRQGKDDIDESTDTYDTIEWLIKNVPANNGKVGMYGTSYPGAYAAMALVQAHPALTAVAPQAPTMDWFMGDDFHRNGAFYLLHAVNFLRMNAIPHDGLIKEWPRNTLNYPTGDLYKFLLEIGPVKTLQEKYFKNRLPFWNQMMAHGSYDDFWQARNVAPHLKDINAAVLNVGGWFDAENLYGPLKCYEAIEKNNQGIMNVLVMGPWYHGGWNFSASDFLGDIKTNAKKESEFYKKEIELPFFNYFLKGEGNFQMPEALVYDVGLGKWNKYDKWPPKSAKVENIYFRDGKKLEFEKPSSKGNNFYDVYMSDPSNPAPHHKDRINRWNYNYMHADQRHNSQRDDVLSYATDTLEKDLTLTGAIDVELYVATTGTDADYIVKIIDVYPEDAPDNSPRQDVKMGGYQMLVRGEAMRGKFRNSFEKPEPFEPGEIEKVIFQLRDIHYTFKRGHKLMIQVQSHWFPVFDRNPQKFVDIYNASREDFQKASHKIYRSKEHPSGIRVKIIK